MSKKILTIGLVVLLAMTCAFAYSGEIKVGINAGVGSDNRSQNNTNILELGGNVTGCVYYGLSDSTFVKFELGLNTYSIGATYYNGKENSEYDLDRNPNAVFYLGFVYNLPLGRNGLFEWELSAGLQGLAGSSFFDDKFNLSLGLGVEETIIFNLTNSFAITTSTRTGVQFVNTNKDVASSLEKYDQTAIPVYITVGANYSL